MIQTLLVQLLVSLQLLNTQWYIAKEAEMRSINPTLALCIVKHESNFNQEARGDDHGYSYSRSWWQISNKWHPEVSDDVAYSLTSSTVWSLDRIKAGYVREWSAYRRYCTHLPVFLDP